MNCTKRFPVRRKRPPNRPWQEVINKYIFKSESDGKDRVCDLTKRCAIQLRRPAGSWRRENRNSISPFDDDQFSCETRLRFVTQITAQPETNWHKHFSNWINKNPAITTFILFVFRSHGAALNGWK